MKKYGKLSKRILAAVLAVTLIISMLPVNAIAEDASIPGSGIAEFKATVTRSEGLKESVTDPETGDTTEIQHYGYSVAATLDGADVTSDCAVVWSVPNETDTTETTATATVSYNNLVLNVSNGVNATGSAVWGVKEIGTVNMLAGVIQKVPAEAYELNDNSSFVDPSQVTVTAKLLEPSVSDIGIGWLASEVGEFDLYSQTIKTGELVVAERVVKGIVDWAPLNTVFTIGETEYADGDETQWFAETQTVTITVSNEKLYAVDSTDFLPKTVLDKDVEWTAVADKEFTWSTSVEVDKTAEVEVGNDTLKVRVDANAPVIADSLAYYTADDKATVEFAVTPSASGIQKVIVADAEYPAEADGKYHFENVTVENGVVKISAVGNNGLTCATVEQAVQIAMTVKVEAPVIAEGYLPKNNANVTVKVYGSAETGKFALDPETTVITANGVEFEAEWTWKDDAWTAIVPLTKNADGSYVALETLRVHAQDEIGREADGEASVAYVVDTTAPVITVSPDPVEGYYNQEKTYTVTITDDLLICGDRGNYNISYFVNGVSHEIKFEEGKNYAKITVKDGEKLERISVSAVDATLNSAEKTVDCNVVVDLTDPVVKFAFNDVVKGVSAKANGNFILLDPVKDDKSGNAVEVILTATVSDANLDTSALTKENGWTENADGSYSKKFTVSVDKFATEQLELNVAASDLAGNKLSGEITLGVPGADNSVLGIPLTAVDGVYTATLNIDRRYPSSNADSVPKMELNANEGAKNSKASEKDLDLFDATLKYFDLSIKDISSNGHDSGVTSVTWEINDGLGGTFITTEQNTAVAESGEYQIPVLINGENEAKNVVIKVLVEDAVGNSFTYSYTCSVDTKAPIISVNDEPGDPVQTVKKDNIDIRCYSAPVQYKFAFTDAFLASAVAEYKYIDGTTGTQNLLENDTFAVTNGQTLVSLVIKSFDLSRNASELVVVNSENAIRVDTVAPKITVTKNKTAAVTTDTVSYYNEAVTYQFTVEDENISNGKAQVAYTLEGKLPVTIDLLEGTTEFTVEANQVLTGMSILVQDDSGLYAKGVSGALNGAFQSDNGTLVYNGKKIAVDGDVPQIAVEKTNAEGSSWKQSTKTHDYYNGEVTYTITVTDNFMDAGVGNYKASVKVVYEDSTNESVALTFTKGDKIAGKDTVTGSFTVKDGKPVKTFSVDVVDIIGNHAVLNTASDSENTLSFSTENGTVDYDGKIIVVDETRPVVTAAISAKGVETETKYTVEKFYSADGYWYTYVTPAVENIFDFIKNALSKTQDNSVELILTFTLDETNPDSDVLKDNGWECNDGVWTRTFTVNVPRDEAEILSFELVTADMARNVPNADVVLGDENGETKNGYAPVVTLVADEGIYKGKLILDRCAPVMPEVPEISLSSDKQFKNGALIELYNEAFTYTIQVTDSAENDSGIRDVSFALNDGLDGEFLEMNWDDKGDNKYEVHISPKKNSETDNAVLTMKVTDHVGNTYTYIRKFAFDNLGPRVEVTKSVEEGYKFIRTLDGVDYYDGKVTYTVTVEDQNLQIPSAKYVVKGEGSIDVAFTADNKSKYTGSFTLENDQVMTDLEISTNDIPVNEPSMVINDQDNRDQDKRTAFKLSENGSYTWNYSGNDVCVDMVTPKLEITKLTEGAYFRTVDDVNYYKGEITYKVKVSDNFLTSDLKLTYSYENEDTVTVELNKNDPEHKWAVSVGNEYEYTYEIPVKNGKVLKSISVEALDNSKNPIERGDITIDDCDGEAAEFAEWHYVENEGVWTFKSANAVDTKAPVVKVQQKVEDGKKYVRSEDGIAYYNGEVTYTITISDEFLNVLRATSTKAIATFADGTEKTVELKLQNQPENSPLVAVDTYIGSFKVVDEVASGAEGSVGEDLIGLAICGMDNAGNYATVVSGDLSDEFTSVEYLDSSDKLLIYNGEEVVVDKVAPVVEMKISDNIVGFYTNGNRSFAALDPEIIDQIAENGDSVQVDLTITVTDEHLSDSCFQNSAYEWTPSTDEATGMDTYTVTLPVKVDRHQTNILNYDVNILDLADYYALNEVMLKVEQEEENGNLLPQLTITPDEGKYVGSLEVDRRAPSSVDGVDIPEVTVTPDAEEGSKKVIEVDDEDRDLFSAEFDYKVNITDLSKNEFDAGIKSIYYTIDDNIDANFLDADGNLLVNGNGVYTIPVTPNGNNESNNVVLTLEIVDNVNNTFVYTHEFAFDNLSPRITVTYNHDDVRNDYYFRADRTATVTIEDINFTPETTSIETEVTPSDWEPVEGENPNLYQSVCQYNIDGEYTFAVTSTDLTEVNITSDVKDQDPSDPDGEKALNGGIIDGVNYGNHKACKYFVLDKTNPVINVTYDPAAYVDTDDNGVQYYDAEQNVTVTITERNFDSTKDITANMGENNTLGNWMNVGGDNHQAKTTYKEGNNYEFTIGYTDLAGNAAQAYTSPVFSVDLTDPTIEISRGSLTNEALNIVQGDLTLGFTINDAQSNLKEYDVKVVRLNNNFVEEEVIGSEYYVITSADERTTVTVDFDKIAKTKGNDGVYTVKISALDYAGHAVDLSPELLFSLNRFGSTFMTDDEFTKDFLKPNGEGFVYKTEVPQQLLVKEINPNRVRNEKGSDEIGSAITIVVNGNTKRLEVDKDYTVVETENGSGDAKWYVYTYEILTDNFANNGETVDGKYSIMLYGVDEAGNKNTNESNEYGNVQQDANGEYTGKIEFTLDHNAPVISVLGVESGERYDESNKRVEINISDSTPTSIRVFLNGEEIPVSEGSMDDQLEGQVWLVWDAMSGNYILNIPESNSRQEIRIEVVDAAGNSAETLVDHILVTTNVIVQLFNNPVFIGSVIAAAVLAIAAIVFKKKKAVAKA